MAAEDSSHPEISDELIARAIRQDEAACSEIIDLIYPLIIGIVRRNLPNSEAPEDLAQETFAQAMRSIGYATGAMGKWGLGPVGSSGDPNSKGFDLFFGYMGFVCLNV